MTIVLLILKIIGIFLLSVLGLAVFLILLLLFVPIRYRVSGSYHAGKHLISLRVSWLLHLLTIAFDLNPEGQARYLRIFGIKKNLEKRDNTEDFEETIERRGETKQKEEPKEPQASQASKENQEEQKESKENQEEHKEQKENQEEQKEHPKKKEKRRKIKDVIGRLKLRERIEKIKAAVKNITETAGKAKALISDEQNRSVLRFLFQKVFWLLQKLAPGKLKLELIYSTGSPDTTGELLGILAMFPFAYQNRWDITPDFTAESFYAEADFDVWGRIFLYHVFGVVISVLRNKECRDLYKKLKNEF